MHRTNKRPIAGLVALLGLSLIAPTMAGNFDVPYCSSQNTADTSAQYWQYQSNGKCTDICNSMGTFAFGIVQDTNCWCSDYIPEDQQDTSECDEGCPGIDQEKCGNKDKGLYGYIKLAGSPSGTMGTSKPTSANVSPSATPSPSSTEAPASSQAMTPSSAPPSPSSSAVETSRDPATVIQTVTAPPEVVTYTPTPSDEPSSSAAPTTFQTSASSTEATTTTTMNPQTSVRVITESGQVKTQTVVFTPSSMPVQTPSQKGTSNTGAIVGGVVGGIAGVAALVGGIFFFLWRRRQQQRQGDDDPSGVQRNTSTMSKAGLLRRGTEKEPQYPPPIATSFTRRQSRTLDQESISPISGSDRRNSRLQVDQRLNPSAIFVFDNSSRGSFGSMDDSRDYHRALNVRNPDPE